MNTDKSILVYSMILTIFISVFSSLIVYKLTSNNNGSGTYITQGNQSNTNKVESKIDLKNLEKNVKNIAKSISPSVVSIIISKDVPTYRSDPFGFFQQPAGTVNRKIGGGTGFFVNKKGFILTNRHVVEDANATYSVITANGKEYVGKILAIDSTNDLAIVQALNSDGKEINDTPAVTFNESIKNIEVGSFVVAIGNALAEFQNTVTFGVISGLGRSIEAGDRSSQSSEQLTGLIQTDTAINPGNSGGPLVNLNGDVVGINTAIAAGANGLGFAIPLSQNEVNYLINSVEKYGKIKRAFLGIRFVPLNENIAKSLGIKQTYGDYIGSGDNNIESVVTGSPADKAGLKSGDIILEINGTPLKDGISTKDILKDKLPDDKIVMKVLAKSGETTTVEVVLGSNYTQ